MRLTNSYDDRSLGAVLVASIADCEVYNPVKGSVTVGSPVGQINRPFESHGRFCDRWGQ